MRLIDADAVFESIRFDREAAKVHPQEMCERFERFCDYAEELVKEAPTIDAEPVRHGRWEHGMQCPYCKQIDTAKPNYCPNCGAKMDEEV